MKTNNTLSIILASYYSENNIVICFNKIRQLFDSEQIPFEFIVIDDGSKDNSYKIALELEKLYENVKAFQLSRNYTHDMELQLYFPFPISGTFLQLYYRVVVHHHQ